MLRHLSIISIIAILWGLAIWQPQPLAADVGTEAGGRIDTLVVINGEPLTSTDIDAIIMNTHRATDMSQISGIDPQKLFDKAINDRLILQQAYDLGLHEEPAVLSHVEEKHTQNAISAFVAANYDSPDSVSSQSVHTFFERYYWKIQLRQLSVRTRAEAVALRDSVAQGAPMDSLALALSLDTRRPFGGLHNLKYWADVENVLRDQARDLEVGEISEPFPIREAFAFIRVEERQPVDRAAFSELEAGLRADLLMQERLDAWQEYLDGLVREIAVTVDPDVLAGIRADQDLLFRGEFRHASETPALVIDENHFTTEAVLRKTISHNAMTQAQAPFDSLVADGIRLDTERLVLRYLAGRGGFYDTPAVMQQYEQDLEAALIDAYLAESIVSSIVFNRAEFQQYYDEHLDDFREPGQVRMAVIIIDDEQTARQIDARLRDGADFRFVTRQYEDAETTFPGESDWAAVNMFSEPIREQLTTMRVGESSSPIEIPSGWMVFKLEDRRRGRARSIEEVDMQIRQVMFQKKFNQLLDQHLKLLKERSEIVLDEQAIAEYFGSDS